MQRLFCHSHAACVPLNPQDEKTAKRATQPMYLKCDPRSFDLASLGSKFDVILIEPPLEEYQRRASGLSFSWVPWDWEDVRRSRETEVAVYISMAVESFLQTSLSGWSLENSANWWLISHS